MAERRAVSWRARAESLLPSSLHRAVLALVACAALSAAVAVPANAKLHVLSRWKVSISGSVRHDWTLASDEPCDATGSGWVKATFKSSRPERSTIANNGYGIGDFTWGGVLHLTGTITAVDARTRNPPEPGGSCDTSRPVPDTRGCVTRKLKDALSVNMPLRGLRRGYTLGNWGNFSNALDTSGTDCELGGFISFAYITHPGKQTSQELKLPGFPTDRKRARRRGTIVVNASQTHSFAPGTKTVRKVRIVFTRTG